MAKRGNGEVWIAREYGMYVFLRLVATLALLWAGFGSFTYGILLDYLGWSHISLELKWIIFVGLSLLVAALTAALFFGAFHLVLKTYRALQRDK